MDDTRIVVPAGRRMPSAVRDRLLTIEHLDPNDEALLEITYTWNADNTVATRTEENAVTSETAVVTFGYDHRQRLTSEARKPERLMTLL